MMKNSLVSEAAKVNAEVISISSAAGATSLPFDMKDHRKGLFVAAAKAAASSTGIFSVVTLDLMESTNATVAGSSAAGGKAGITIGSSVNTSIPSTRGVQKILLEIGTATTTSDKMSLSIGSKTRYFQWSSATANHNATAWGSTLSYFGSTVGSTADTGLQLSIANLGSVIRSTINFGPNVVVSTPTTGTLTVEIDGDENDNLGFASTASTAFMIGNAQKAVGAFNIDAAELSTGGKRFISIKASSAATAVQVGITGVRMGARYKPDGFSGNLSTVNYTT